MMKKLVIFDLDGTLLDTAKSLQECMNYALEKNGFKKITLSQTRAYVGNGSLLFALRACKDEQKAEDVHNDFLSVYKNYPSSKVKPFANVKKLLKTLNEKGVKLAVFSNKPHFATQILCDDIFKNNTFDYILGHKEGAPLKPDKQGVIEILSKLNVDAQDTVLIGDGETDALTAINAGVDFIGALWGFRTKDQLQSNGAKCFADTPKDLINFII